MILDRLENAALYWKLHPGLEAAFKFLGRADLAALPAGRNEIDGERLYAMVAIGEGRGRDGAKHEAHRRYIDIHYALDGTDEIGWKPTATCVERSDDYDAEQDADLFTEAADAWIALPPGTFAVFFPEDAHAPMAGAGDLHKVIVKVAVDWD